MAFRTSVSGKSPISDTRTFLERAFSNLKRTLADGKSPAKAFHLSLREKNLYFLGQVSSPNLAKRSRRRHPSQCILHPCRLEHTEKYFNIPHVMDCLRRSIMD